MPNRDEGLFSAYIPPHLTSLGESQYPNVLKSRDKSGLNRIAQNIGECVAGVVGFEPTIHATKKHCLTTWLHPIRDGVNTMVLRVVQVLILQNMLIHNRLKKHDLPTKHPRAI